MTLAAQTWRRSALQTLATSDVAGSLAGYNSLFVAELAAHALTAKWQVADSNATNGTLTLKPTANNAGSSSRRIILFGKSSPSSAAIDSSTANTTTIYMGYAPTANVDAPQQAYTSGVPYTTGLYLPGGIFLSSFTSIDRCEYWECDAGIFFVLRKAAITAASANIATAFAGEFGVSLDGLTAFEICCASAGAWSSSQDNPSSGTAAGYWFASVAPGAGGHMRANYNESGTVRRCHRLDTVSVETDTSSLRLADGTRYIIPVRFVNDSQTRMFGKLRQMGMGIQEVHGQTMSSVAGVMAHKIGGRSDLAAVGPWLTNYAI